VGNLFGDNASLGIAAVGMTFVILAGGIDLSVGSVLAFTTILVATLVQQHHVSPLLAIPLALILGAGFGAAMGLLIHRYELPPFLVTLGGMFFARGLAFVVSRESVGITHALYNTVLEFALPMGSNGTLSVTALAFLACVILGFLGAHATRFGRNVYALGGSESSARLMGLPIGPTRIGVYTLSGFCSALAGVVSTFYKSSGNPADGMGFELDVIASVVIGGTLLTGGVGSMVGTLTGVLIFGTIQTALTFDGRLDSSWLRIAMGALLLLFILFQRFLSRTAPALH
jgi:simple sugar transport system permease protein